MDNWTNFPLFVWSRKTHSACIPVPRLRESLQRPLGAGASRVDGVGCANSIPAANERMLDLRTVFALPRRGSDAAGLTSCLSWLQNRGVSESSADAGVPGRSREQRLRALEQANEVRTARAELKRQLASGKIELAEILANPPPCARTARVRDLLVALPKIGSVRAGRILGHCGIAHSKTLGGLTDRQRGTLISLFRD